MALLAATTFAAGSLATYLFNKNEREAKPSPSDESVRDEESSPTTSTETGSCSHQPQTSSSSSEPTRNSLSSNSSSTAIAACANSVFTNLGEVGAGSFCQVFKVRRTSDSRIFALKRSSTQLRTEESVNLALNEVSVMRVLQTDEQHSHVAYFHTHWLSPFQLSSSQMRDPTNINFNTAASGNSGSSSACQLHQLYDFYARSTLSELARSDEALNPRQILQCLAQLLDGLAFVHAHNVLHLDVKPSNIFVADNFCLKLGDFGISIDLSAAQTSGSNKIAISGDPLYIAPEVLGFGRALEDVGFAADIFALGVIALELLYHMRVPSQGPIFEALRNFADFDAFDGLIDGRKVDHAKSIDGDGEIKAIIAKMLQQKPGARPTAAQSLRYVGRLLSGNDFAENFAGLDAIELELTLADDTPSLLIPCNASTLQTTVPSSPAPILSAMETPPPRAEDERRAPSPAEFAQTAEKSFQEMEAKLCERDAISNSAKLARSHRRFMRCVLFSPEPKSKPTAPTRQREAMSPLTPQSKTRPMGSRPSRDRKMRGAHQGVSRSGSPSRSVSLSSAIGIGMRNLWEASENESQNKSKAESECEDGEDDAKWDGEESCGLVLPFNSPSFASQPETRTESPAPTSPSVPVTKSTNLTFDIDEAVEQSPRQIDDQKDGSDFIEDLII